MKTPIKIIGIAMSCVTVNLSQGQTSLQSYIDTALKNNPTLQVYSLKSKSLEQQVKYSKAWDDPMFSIGLENVPVNFNLNGDEMTMKQIGFRQNFSIAKKYSLKEKVAQKEFEANRYNTDAQKLLLIYKVKREYYDLYATRKAIETTQNSIKALKNFIAIADTRYSIGTGTKQDVIKAQLEVTKMEEELVKLMADESDMTANFNSLLFRDKSAPLSTTAEIKFTSVPMDMKSPYGDVYEKNPELLSAQISITKDSADYLLARTSRIPDFEIGGYYGQRQYRFSDGAKAADMFGVSLGFTLPLWSKKKQNPMTAQANINIQKSKAELDAMTNEVELMIHHAMNEAQKNETLILHYTNQLIPLAEENLNAGITGYQQNKIDFMTLMDNFLSLYNYRLQRHHAVADYYKAIAELEMLKGKPLMDYSY